MMSDVVSWVVEVSVKTGQVDNFKGLVEELVQSTRNEPNTLAYEYFLSPDGGTCHIYERYADSGAVMTHLGTFGERFAERFLSMVDVAKFSVYGDPDEQVRGALGGFGASFLEQINGFAR